MAQGLHFHALSDISNRLGDASTAARFVDFIITAAFALEIYVGCPGTGSGIIGPGLGSIVNINSNLMSSGAMDATFNNMRSLSEDRDITGMMGRNGMSEMMDLNSTSLTTSASLMNNANGTVALKCDSNVFRAARWKVRCGVSLGVNGQTG